jgi:hypothetical protein
MFGNWSEIFSLISYDEIPNFDISKRKVYRMFIGPCIIVRVEELKTT